MKKLLQILSFAIGASILISGTIDLDYLLNYENQSVPVYITQDNMPATNPITDEGATLGRVLFYDKKLSTDNTVSCASCHQQQFAFGDTATLSQGVNGLTLRHSMRLVNIRFAEDTLFRWDRTAEKLEDQMINPIKNFEEMGYSGTNGAPDFQALIDKLSTTTYYPTLFKLVYGDDTITEERIAKALAQFVMSIQSFDSKYDVGRTQVANDLVDFPNFTAQENRGKALFIDSFTVVQDTITVIAIGSGVEEKHAASRRVSGGFNCASCHRLPEFDIDPASLNNGFVRGNIGSGIITDYTVTRSPSLRDLIDPYGNVNGPLFHAGQTNDLSGINIYNFRKIDPNNDNLDPRYTPDGLPQWLDMTNEERQDLFAFLRTLSGTDVYTNERWSDPFDENGDITIVGGSITSTNEAPVTNKHIHIYPNPVSTEFNISGDLDLYRIEVLNSAGQVHHFINPYGNIHTVDISTLPSGLYLVRVYNLNNELLEVQKLIKR